MYKVGTVCIKNAGRDRGLYCVVLNEKDGKVLIDGQTRRRSVSSMHLSPTEQTVEVKKDASTKEVIAAFAKLNLEVKETKPKPAQKRPKSKRSLVAAEKKVAKQVSKKTAAPVKEKKE